MLLSKWTSGVLALIVVSGCSLGFAQDTEQSLPVPSRILSPVDEGRLVELRGNTHPMARTEFDKGLVSATLPMERMLLLLNRSAEQEASLEALMAEQQEPQSPNYHRWLSPEEFGSKYGPSTEDIQKVTGWLSSHGFAIEQVSKGRLFIEFSGTASQVQETFHTEIHRLQVSGEEHVANVRDPQIPEALAPVVSGVVSLHNFFAQPQHIAGADIQRNGLNGKWQKVEDSQTTKPLFASNDGGSIYEYVSPWDFATIYNVTPLWNAGIDGTGQIIAIAGRSDISLADVANFRKAFSLPVKAPVVIVNGKDPGTPSAGDREENTLDVEWSGAVAKGATVKFVTSASTSTSDGAVLSATYIIDHKVAPVMSYSYGLCELGLGKTGNAATNKLWQQGAAEGIAIFVASGDQGSAVCDGGQQAPYAANFGLAVNGLSSTPYNVSVGGTDLNWGGSPSTYWNATNAANGSSVKRYIPEVPWNDTCASDIIDAIIGVTGEEAACNAVIGTNDEFLIQIVGGSGGKSACTTPSSNTVASCSGGYAKPTWQVATGVPKDAKRDLPDVSLFAADGLVGSAYIVCDSQTTPCTFSNATDARAQTVGGTSVSSPAFAGIMALINQKMKAPQGFPNPSFYKLYAKEAVASCNSNTVGATNTCVFYDTDKSNNKVPCIPGSPNCVTSTKGDQVGVLAGNVTTVGYDLATGLGSVNVTNLVNKWSTVGPTAPIATITPTSLTFAGTVVGIASAAQTVTLKNTGTAALAISSIAISGTNASSFVKSATTCGATLAVAATCTVQVELKPAAAGALTASLKFTDNAAGSPQAVTLKGTGLAKPVATVTPAKLTYVATTVGVAAKVQVVTLKNASTTSPMVISSIVLAGTGATSYTKTTTCTTTLAAAKTCTVSVTFKPKAKGTLSGTLTFTDDATTGKQIVTLTGTGK